MFLAAGADGRGADQGIGVDLGPERLIRAAYRGVTVFDLRGSAESAGVIRDLADGRGSDSVIGAVSRKSSVRPWPRDGAIKVLLAF